MHFGIRADCGSKVGSGHIKRCMVLAQELINRGATVNFFVGGEVNLAVKKEIRALGAAIQLISLQGYSEIKDWSKKYCNGVTILVVDHYSLGIEYHSAVRSMVDYLMVIDDLANRKLMCDILLDQNFYQNPQSRYGELVPKSCERLLGPKFALLREEFRQKFSKYKAPCSETSFNVLVFFGGGDQTVPTLKTLKALRIAKIENLKCFVLSSSLNPRREKIKSYCNRLPEMFYLEDVNNISDLMIESHLAVGSGGSVSLERAWIGLPAIVVTVADNQFETTVAYSEAGAISYLGNFEDVSTDNIASEILRLSNDTVALRKMSQCCSKIFESSRLGAQSVCNRIYDYIQRREGA